MLDFAHYSRVSHVMEAIVKHHFLGGLALLLAAAWMPRAAEALSVTVDCAIDPPDTIAGALNDAAMDIDPDIVTVNGTCTENVEIRQDDVTIQGDPNDGGDAIVGQLLVNGAHRVTIQDLTITSSPFNGIAAVDGAAVTIARVTVDGAAESGVLAVNGASVNLNEVTIQNSGGDGIHLDFGALGFVVGSTIQNNATIGIFVFRHSSAVLGGNTIQGNPAGVSVIETSEAWLDENTISNSSADEDALFIGWGSSVKLNGGNTVTSNGSVIFLRQGATLNQRNGDVVDGPVTIDALSNAEFRNVSITGNVEVVDHSLLRIKDQSDGPGHISLSGNVSLSQDSGLNFIRLEGEQLVHVIGNVTCADKESSLSAPPSAVTIGGMKDCTGY